MTNDDPPTAARLAALMRELTEQVQALQERGAT